ncbi:MAG: hypothetical protein NVS1B2_16040 [Vulcanimicrobiaceae bacterium]
MNDETPNPGSDAALALGCECPVIDNGHGRGARPDEDGTMMFWTNDACPIHANASWRVAP